MTAPVIVVGVDGSTGATHALRWAAGFAAARQGTLRVVMGWDYPALAVLPAPLGMPVPAQDAMDRATHEALASVVAPVREEVGIEIVEAVRRGTGAHAVLAEATAAQADLVVVGTRGAGRVQSVLFGSVSRKVAAAAPCPVAVVPEATELASTGPVLVGVDGSESSLAALRWAGQATDGPIRALHVFEYPFGPEYAVAGFEWSDPEDFGRELLARAVAEALGDRSDVTTIASAGDAREVLVEASYDASLVVVGARGATGFQGLLLGSVTTDLASRAAAPVVIVPSG